MPITNSICTNNAAIAVQSNGATISMGTSGAGAISIGSSAAGALSLASGAASTIAINNQSLAITTGTGAINIGADATAKTITIGTITGATALNLIAGSGGLAIANTASTNTISIGTLGTKTINIGNNNSGTNLTFTSNFAMTINGGTSIDISANNQAITVNLGTGAAAKTVNVGSTNTTSATTINSGTGAINIGTSIAKTITIGNNTGATAVNVNTGTGGYVITTTNGVYTVATGTGTVSISGDATANTLGFGNGAGAKTVTIGSTNTTSTTTLNCGSGGINIPSFTTTGALVSNASGLITDANASTAGFVLTSNGAGSAPSFQAASGGGGVTWNDVTGTSASMAVNNAYSANNAGLVTLTLPATAAFGSIVQVSGNGAGGWTIAQNSGQTIHFGAVNTTTGVGGSLSSTSRYDQVVLVCSVANTDWVVNSSLGMITYV